MRKKIGFILCTVCLSMMGFLTTAKAAALYPCDIKIVNLSNQQLHVTGLYDDGTYLVPFDISANPNQPPHILDLYYYGYCHEGMTLTISNMYGYPIYSAFTPVNHTIKVRPFLRNPKAILER